ncbi:site-specific integrase [Psychrobacter sp. BI730]|uniref:site-specific integrase n=1 Tax=Psychrobacter sp. BI730 TaxID=2705463 RepID=UPI0015C9A541|nr:site-specific integrase [Psychrobacter sp. BI730]NYR10819.1 site-specific integrase [Psychrobacter sp. BI730]
MDNAVAHQLREENKSKSYESIKNEAKALIASYIDDNQIPTGKDLTEYYQTIGSILEMHFDTAHSYYLARQGFLEFIRSYNKLHGLNLDEPVVPVIAERDHLTISYDWMVNVAQVSLASQQMIEIWQRKRRFSNNDLIESVLYCSVMYGGLNDIDVLKALYQWLIGERDIYQLLLPATDELPGSGVSSESLALILLSIDDDNYGCSYTQGHISEDISATSLQRYVEYIPDDMTLCFLYALKDKKLKKEDVKSFETIISDICKKLKLQNKDKSKPHLSQLIKYADYHWRQIKGGDIDTALAIVRQGKIKTTGLTTNKLINYNQEVINSNLQPLTWEELFVASFSESDEKGTNSREYPSFSKNLIKEVQDALKGSKASAIIQVELLQQELTEPNAMRLLGWVNSLLSDNNSRLDTISKYLGCIGRDWLMLTMDENLDEWSNEDFEAIYEEIIQSKIKDGRKQSILHKDTDFNEDNLDKDDKLVSLSDDELNQSIHNGLTSEAVQKNKASRLYKLKDTQKLTYGRLKAFHDYQKEFCGAPYVYFPWGNKRQVVKANMISPRIYHTMKEYLVTSDLEYDQKNLCLVVLSLAYRTGMRIKELIGVKVRDVADIYIDEHGQRIEQPQIWLRPNRYRRLKSSSASRLIPINCLLKKDELEQFTQLYRQQKRLKRRYLFSQGSGDQPLPSIFFRNLMKLIWDKLLGEHDFTFHSFRHTAISQLALVLSKSPLAQVMTDYDNEQCEKVIKGILGYHKKQGAWFGLASLSGHLTCDTTFEYYIHTAHLLAGKQLSNTCLELPITVLDLITGLDYSAIYRKDKTAYDAKTKTVQLNKIRPYLLKKMAINKIPLFKNVDEPDNNASHQLLKGNLDEREESNTSSIFIHPKYADVIGFLEELQRLNINSRDKLLPEVAIRHGISLNESKCLYLRASELFDDDRLLLGKPRGSKNQEIMIRALDRAYQMSINNPEQLQRFVEIFENKNNFRTSTIQFGIRPNQLKSLKDFMAVGCQLIDSSQWQIRASNKQAVIDLKKKLKIDKRVRIGSRQNFHGYDVRVIEKKRKRSDKNMAKTDRYDASSSPSQILCNCHLD